jgi:hypothetical protein
MTNDYELADDSRENLIWTKEQLLAPLDLDMEMPPHPMRLGETERDYYRLGSAGAAAGHPEEPVASESGHAEGWAGEPARDTVAEAAAASWTPDAHGDPNGGDGGGDGGGDPGGNESGDPSGAQR